jgi:hypothetical protein
MQQAKKSWFDMIAISFLSNDLKKKFKKIILEKFSRLNKNS